MGNSGGVMEDDFAHTPWETVGRFIPKSMSDVAASRDKQPSPTHPYLINITLTYKQNKNKN